MRVQKYSDRPSETRLQQIIIISEVMPTFILLPDIVSYLSVGQQFIKKYPSP
jgi:hypothetical protein